VNRRIATTLLALLALVAGACSNASDDSDDASGGGTAVTADDGGALSYAEVLELPIDENVPVQAPGVDDQTIRVGGVASITNPIGGVYGEAFDGVQAYFDMINEDGGIYGRQLEITAMEDDNTGFENREDIQSLISQDIFAVVPIATLDFSGADLLVQENIPSFGWNINEEYNEGPNLFGERGFLCFTCASPGLPWLAQEVGATSVGVLAYDVPQSADCAEGIQNSFDAYPTAEIGFFDDSLQYGIPDMSAQVDRMKDAGVDLVTTCMDFNGATTLQQEMNSQNLDAIQYLPNGYDYTFLEENGDLFDGAYVLTNFVPFEVPDDEKPEGMQLYEEWIDESGGNVGELSLGGWLAADLFVTGLRAAGPEFSRQGVIDGLNQLTDWDGQGLVADIDWTESHESEGDESCFAMSQIVDGDHFEPVFGEPGKPFICFPLGPGSEVPDQPEVTD
jgi:branched-chain amino acid transport system substrate-binding protein